MEITTRAGAKGLSYRYQLVTENKNWHDAERYCFEKYHSSLVVIDSLMDEVTLKAYLKPLLGQLACRLILVFIDLVTCSMRVCSENRLCLG